MKILLWIVGGWVLILVLGVIWLSWPDEDDDDPPHFGCGSNT